MKTLLFPFLLVWLIISCQTTQNTIDKNSVSKPSDTTKIVNEALEYEVIIIDPGFSSWMISQAFPRGYHSESYLELKNYRYVTEWNRRAQNTFQYDPNLYSMTIDYNPTIHYGYEVNYMIYNYFIYFQNTYNQTLTGLVPNR